ncbi:AraC-type DNA-binding protein [Verrucomicrobium sp. GAS474]|uniref:helix-turn-helix domain-containing protein n=1 Tax=Verrucomicrobium sp. GAS474 TaxID=1882831 RepID=UPI00087A35A3|nr:AraC family transcriptional regulator [Verrucomicrobium sp. GAS474]SDT91175.1 AraC-type DNA-binding protein [Verrucomicrobium sp. GAS474]
MGTRTGTGKGRSIPVYQLGEYRRPQLSPDGVHVCTLAESFAHYYQRRHPHVHPFFQVFFASGAGRFMHDFRDYAIRGPVLAFVSPGQVHAMSLTPQLRGLFVSFTPDFFDQAAPPPSRLPDFPFFYAAGVDPFLRLKGGDAARFRALFAELKREFDSGLPGAGPVMRALLEIIFTRAARLYPASSSSPSSSLSRPARLAREFLLAVERRFAEPVTLAAYAALLQVTPNHLNDTLRRETGQAAGEWVRQRRLLEAKRLLLHSDLDAAEIGYRLGFADPSYFGRFFLRGEGASPSAFRQKIREKYQRRAA